MSGLIQGADKWVCLSPASKVFLSVICTIEAWEKKTNNQESEKALQKTEKTQGTQYSEAGALLAVRQRVLVTGTSLPSCSSNRPSPPLLSWVGPVSPGTASALLLLLPSEGRGRGDTCSWLRGDIRSHASLWDWALPLAGGGKGRQYISGSENLPRVLFQNVCNTFF